MRGFFIFEGTPSFLKKYQKGTPSLLIAVPQPQVILERLYIKDGVQPSFITICIFQPVYSTSGSIVLFYPLVGYDYLPL